MNTHFQCCKNFPSFEIEYEIGTIYMVCKDCSEKKHFARGIKLKKSIDSNPKTSLLSTPAELDSSKSMTGAVVSE